MDESMNSNDTCVVCYNNIDEGNLCRTNCNHIYCEDCLNIWFNRGNVDCPMCRLPIKSYENNGIQNKIVTIANRREDNNNMILIQTQNTEVIDILRKRYNYIRVYFIVNTCYLLYLQYRNYILYNECHH